MYNQVYMHPTTVCCEELLKNIFKLASNLVKDDNLDSPATLEKALNRETLASDEFVELTDNDVFYALGLWKNATHTELSDLCRRFLNRNLLKPIKNIKIDLKKLFYNKEKIEKILNSKGFDPEYYLVLIDGGGKYAYVPSYSPDLKDRENAIIAESGKDISEELPNLVLLQIGEGYIMGVPEECKDDIIRLITPKNT